MRRMRTPDVTSGSVGNDERTGECSPASPVRRQQSTKPFGRVDWQEARHAAESRLRDRYGVEFLRLWDEERAKRGLSETELLPHALDSPEYAEAKRVYAIERQTRRERSVKLASDCRHLELVRRPTGRYCALCGGYFAP